MWISYSILLILVLGFLLYIIFDKYVFLDSTAATSDKKLVNGAAFHWKIDGDMLFIYIKGNLYSKTKEIVLFAIVIFVDAGSICSIGFISTVNNFFPK